MESFFVILFLILSLFALFYGGVKAFQRNWLLFILLFLFFFPGLAIWALFECFTGPVKPKVYNVRVMYDSE